MLKSKKVLALALAAVMVLSLAACSGSNSSSGSGDVSNDSSSSKPAEKVTLEYWFEGAGPERTPTSEKIINDWNAANPDIQVNGLYVDLTDGLNKVNVAWAGGGMPDIIYLQDSWMSDMFIQGMCLDLTERFDAWDEKDQFDTSCIKSMTDKDIQGRLFAIPTATNLTGIWYRKDIFAEKGVEAPTTWDNFFDACEKLTDKEANVYGHTLRGGSGALNQVLYEIVAYVGEEDFFDADGKAVLLRNPLAAEYVTRFSDLYKKGYAPESSLTAGFKEMVADFNANLAMTLIHNLGSYENQRQTFTPDQYAFVPFPPAVNGKLSTIVPSCKGIGIASTTKYPDQAWEYTKWNCSEDAISSINEAVGELPTRIDSSNHEWVKTAPHMSNLPAFTAAEKISVNIPTYLPDYSTIQKTEMEPVFQEVLTGKTDVATMMDKWASLYEAAYAEYVKEMGGAQK